MWPNQNERVEALLDFVPIKEIAFLVFSEFIWPWEEEDREWRKTHLLDPIYQWVELKDFISKVYIYKAVNGYANYKIKVKDIIKDGEVYVQSIATVIWEVHQSPRRKRKECTYAEYAQIKLEWKYYLGSEHAGWVEFNERLLRLREKDDFKHLPCSKRRKILP